MQKQCLFFLIFTFFNLKAQPFFMIDWQIQPLL